MLCMLQRDASAIASERVKNGFFGFAKCDSHLFYIMKNHYPLLTLILFAIASVCYGEEKLVPIWTATEFEFQSEKDWSGAKPHGQKDEVMPTNKPDSKIPTTNQAPTLSDAVSRLGSPFRGSTPTNGLTPCSSRQTNSKRRTTDCRFAFPTLPAGAWNQTWTFSTT